MRPDSSHSRDQDEEYDDDRDRRGRDHYRVRRDSFSRDEDHLRILRFMCVMHLVK